MKFKLHPMFAALCAAAICGAGNAAVVVADANEGAEPEIVADTRTIVIEDGVVMENSGKSTPEIFIAQAATEGTRKEVKIIRSGPGANFPDLPDVDAIVSSAMSEAFAGAAHGPFAKPVKNAPYSAEVVTEKKQSLPDGNLISKRTSAMTYRDSAGRTRQETRDAKGEVKTIHINDSVAGTRYVLSPSGKSATKLATGKEFGKQMADIKEKVAAAKEKAKATAKSGETVIVENPGPGQEIVVKRIVRPGEDGRNEVQENVRVQVTRLGGDAKMAMDDTGFMHFNANEATRHSLVLGDEIVRPGAFMYSFTDGKWSAKATTTQLGTKDIEGVRAEGKSMSYTIPAGEIGNKNPITVTTETWYSPDLQATVYSKTSDPRVGETTYRLANVKRTEQPASLFAVPEGYTVKEAPTISIRTQKQRE